MSKLSESDQLRLLIREILLSEKIAGKKGRGSKIGKAGRKSLFKRKKKEDVDQVAVQSASGEAAANAEAQFQAWGGKKETDPTMDATLFDYWKGVGLSDEKARRYITDQLPWSAAFISKAHENDPDFKKSASHSTYMRAAKKARDAGAKTGYVAYRPEELEGGPERNDIICRPRGSGDGYDNIGAKNHCDIYDGNGMMIGGNLGNTSKKVPYKPKKATMIIKKLAEAIGDETDEEAIREIIKEILVKKKVENPEEVDHYHVELISESETERLQDILSEEFSNIDEKVAGKKGRGSKISQTGQTNLSGDKEQSKDGSDDSPSGSFSGETGGGGGAGETEKQGSSVVIKMPKDDGGFDNPNLLYIYPGINTGTQPKVVKIINSTVGSQQNTIVVVAAMQYTDWAAFKKDGIDAYKSITGKEPSSARMVGWSAGAAGLSKATGDAFLSEIWYADPSPTEKLAKAKHGNVKMYYNPDVWTRLKFTHDGSKLPGNEAYKKLVATVPNATKVSDSHKEIFVQSAKEALAESSSVPATEELRTIMEDIFPNIKGEKK